MRCGNTHFQGQIWGYIPATLEGHAGMADSEGCERNPFARDVFRPKVVVPENLSEIEKIVCPYRFGPLRHAFLNLETITLASLQCITFEVIHCKIRPARLFQDPQVQCMFLHVYSEQVCKEMLQTNYLNIVFRYSLLYIFVSVDISVQQLTPVGDSYSTAIKHMKLHASFINKEIKPRPYENAWRVDLPGILSSHVVKDF